MASTYPRPRSVLAGSAQFGQPVSYTSGCFAGRTLRAELEEIQAADIGRKYARKDKRPLDPPPVVVCRVWEVLSASNGNGTYERELDPETVALGAICHVDLFPVPEECRTAPGAGLLASPPAPSIYAGPTNMVLPSLSSIRLNAPSAPWPAAPFPPGPLPPVPDHSANLPSLASPSGVLGIPTGRASYARAAAAPQLPVLDPDIVGWFGLHPIHGRAQCTGMLAGGTVVQAEVIHYEGRKTVMFVFSDLAVKSEGTFVLRYRAGDIYSQDSTPNRSPLLAECFGGPFKVYATKEFPGLNASTDLTKLLARQNVRVHLRQSDRKRRRKPGVKSAPPLGDGVVGTGRGEGSSRPSTSSGSNRRPKSLASAARARTSGPSSSVGAGESSSEESSEDDG